MDPPSDVPESLKSEPEMVAAAAAAWRSSHLGEQQGVASSFAGKQGQQQEQQHDNLPGSIAPAVTPQQGPLGHQQEALSATHRAAIASIVASPHELASSLALAGLSRPRSAAEETALRSAPQLPPPSPPMPASSSADSVRPVAIPVAVSVLPSEKTTLASIDAEKNAGSASPSPQRRGKPRAGKSRVVKCTVQGCGRFFSRRANMMRHVRTTHMGYRPFPCPYAGCLKRFGLLFNLKKHHQAVHWLQLPEDYRRAEHASSPDHAASDDADAESPALSNSSSSNRSSSAHHQNTGLGASAAPGAGSLDHKTLSAPQAMHGMPDANTMALLASLAQSPAATQQMQQMVDALLRQQEQMRLQAQFQQVCQALTQSSPQLTTLLLSVQAAFLANQTAAAQPPPQPQQPQPLPPRLAPDFAMPQRSAQVDAGSLAHPMGLLSTLFNQPMPNTLPQAPAVTATGARGLLAPHDSPAAGRAGDAPLSHVTPETGAPARSIAGA